MFIIQIGIYTVFIVIYFKEKKNIEFVHNIKIFQNKRNYNEYLKIYKYIYIKIIK